ncbi:trophoblast glycoprotein-like [Synchiropus picturatus]
MRVPAVLLLLFCAQCRSSPCPAGCECFTVTRTVKCVSQNLVSVPRGIPGYARTVVITGNSVARVSADSLTELGNVSNLILSSNRVTELTSHSFSALLNLRFLDLSGNQLALIHPEALSIPGSPLQELNLSRALFNFTSLTDLTTALRWGNLRGLLRLDLSGNRLALLPPGMFSHLPNLQQLILTNNSLIAVYTGTFSGMNHLKLLDLTRNSFKTLRVDDLQELEKLGDVQILLGNNPYSCSCESQTFVAWLNQSRAQVDLEAVRCSSPAALTNTRLRGLGLHSLGCVVPFQPELHDISLQTSYVFLGLVLGFVGMVFLFVLYLNRKGMKKWINEMRDACRDVLEGYHYRYEIDSDPRLGHIAAGNGGAAAAVAAAHLRPSLSQQLPTDTCMVPTEAPLKPVMTSPPQSL